MEVIRIILITSVIIVAVFAISFLIYTFVKIKKIKNKLNEEENNILKNISNKQGEVELRKRKDLGEPLYDLQNKIGSTISHEIVEFCINSCIRNEYKNVLFLDNVEPYEVITLANKTKTNVFVKKQDFDNKKYLNLDLKNVIEHKLEILDLPKENYFDLLLVLNSTKDFEKIFNDNEKYLKKNGMFIFANVKANKMSLKNLIRAIEKMEFRYDLVKWYTWFVVIVK